ncbi:MAG: histidine--tRNA ligase, partial [Chloroflexi bacterium]|nr:histidine--tRNA ligase [Chloroflexota bacterium]
LPLDVLQRDFVVEVVERVYQRYGFEPLETPAMERLSTLTGKYGEEGDQLIFRLLKRGQQLAGVLRDTPTESSLSEEGLRYDLTVPLARVIAEYRHQLPPIFKRYQIQPVYRAERPAKGRFREFYQCDVDIVGTRSLLAEAEELSAACEVLQELGFRDDASFALRLNHRWVLKGLMEVAGVEPDLEGEAMVAIDKLDKIGLDGVRRDLQGRGIGEAAAARLLGHMAAAPKENDEVLDWLGRVVSGSDAGTRGVAELRTLLSFAHRTPAARYLRVDPYLARGLSYYTGAIFEIVAPDVSGSLAGGGRYDDLLGMFAGQSIPACGISLGLERIILVMNERGMFPDRLAGRPEVLVTQFDETTAAASLELAHRLRAGGVRTDLYPDFKGYGAQFKYADRRNIRFAALLGTRELEEHVVAIRDLLTGDQVDVPRDEIREWLTRRLRAG